MTAMPLTDDPSTTTPTAHPSLRRALLHYVFLQGFLWLTMLATVSTISASAWGNSAYTLGIAVTSVCISSIWLIATQRLSLPSSFVELFTLFVVVGILSNPMRRGVTASLATLTVWVFIEGCRHLLRQRRSSFTNFGSVVILLGIAILVDGRNTPDMPMLAIVAVWAVSEAVWLALDQRFLQGIVITFRLTRRQKLALALVGAVIIGYLGVKWSYKLTTVQYYDRTTTMSELVAERKRVHCIQQHWYEAGIDLSYWGFGGQLLCFDTEAEVQQYSEQQRGR